MAHINTKRHLHVRESIDDGTIWIVVKWVCAHASVRFVVVISCFDRVPVYTRMHTSLQCVSCLRAYTRACVHVQSARPSD